MSLSVDKLLMTCKRGIKSEGMHRADHRCTNTGLLAGFSPTDIAIPFEVCAPFHCFYLLLLTVLKPDPIQNSRLTTRFTLIQPNPTNSITYMTILQKLQVTDHKTGDR